MSDEAESADAERQAGGCRENLVRCSHPPSSTNAERPAPGVVSTHSRMPQRARLRDRKAVKPEQRQHGEPGEVAAAGRAGVARAAARRIGLARAAGAGAAGSGVGRSAGAGRCRLCPCRVPAGPVAAAGPA